MKFAIVDQGKKTTYMVETFDKTSFKYLKKEDFMISENLRIWKIPGCKNCIAYATGSLRYADLLRYQPLFRGNLTIEKLMTDVTMRIKSILDEYGMLLKDKTSTSNIIIAKNDQVYQINRSFKVAKIYRFVFEKAEASTKLIYQLENRENTLELIEKILDAHMNKHQLKEIDYAVLDTSSETVRYYRKEAE